MSIQHTLTHMLLQCKDVCTMWSCKGQSFATLRVAGVRDGRSQYHHTLLWCDGTDWLVLGLAHHHEKHAASLGSHKFVCPFPSLSDKGAVTSTGMCWWGCVCMSAFAPGCTREGLQKRHCLVMQVVEGLRGQSRLRAGTCLGCEQGFVHTRVCAWAALMCLCAHKAACTCGLAHWHMPICSAPPR